VRLNLQDDRRRNATGASVRRCAADLRQHMKTQRRAQRMKRRQSQGVERSINAQYFRFHEGRRVLGLPLSRTVGDVSAGALIW
jgi:hypothetical protein